MENIQLAARGPTRPCSSRRLGSVSSSSFCRTSCGAAAAENVTLSKKVTARLQRKGLTRWPRPLCARRNRDQSSRPDFISVSR